MKKEMLDKFWGSPSKGELDGLLEAVLAGLGEVVIIDEAARIIYMSEDYAKNMGVPLEESLGRRITEVIEDSVLPSVLKSGKAMKGVLYYRNGNAFWINRIPLRDGERIIGVMGQSILTKSLETNQIEEQLNSAIRQLNYYKEKYEAARSVHFDLDSIVSRSPAIERLKETVRIVAGTRSSVLITGESGTGKELFASALHNLSGRRKKPFIRLNCAAIPDTLLESELFGYEAGAFTGALKGGKIGDFEAANGGTIFMDEVDSLSPNMQSKLLRVLQEREIKKLGSAKPVPIDVRFIFATNADLPAMIQKGDFREDFYYRINVVNLNIPPLKERPEDIIPLANLFMRKYNIEMNRSISGIESAALSIMEGYSWPGNVRELENCIERAFNYARTDTIRAEDIMLMGLRLSEKGSPNAEGAQGGLALKDVRARAERLAILQALEMCRGNRSEAARLLRIDRSILYDKMRQYHIE